MLAQGVVLHGVMENDQRQEGASQAVVHHLAKSSIRAAEPMEWDREGWRYGPWLVSMQPGACAASVDESFLPHHCFSLSSSMTL